MKQSRLVLAAFLVAALGTSAVLAYACSEEKGASTASASSHRAACGTSSAKSTQASKSSQSSKTSTFTSRVGSLNAVVASSDGGACAHGATTTAAHGACSAAKTSAVTASAGDHCGATKSAVQAGAVTASAGDACCAGKSAAKASAITAANASGSCGFGATGVVASIGGQSGVDAMTAGSSCGSKSSSAKGTMAHGGCDACSDMATCEGELQHASASVQVVPLKNGVMYVYTANGASRVQAVQAAMTRRADRMNAVIAAGDRAHLCPECKTMRGAIASGKLHREQVNIEGGCLTLMTSSDAAMVTKLHAMAGLKGGARAKS